MRPSHTCNLFNWFQMSSNSQTTVKTEGGAQSRRIRSIPEIIQAFTSPSHSQILIATMLKIDIHPGLGCGTTQPLGMIWQTRIPGVRAGPWGVTSPF